MTAAKPEWLKLFQDSEPNETAAALMDPARFAERASDLCRLLEAYNADHRIEPGAVLAWTEVEFTAAWDLHRFLEGLHTRASLGQQIGHHRAKLIDLFEAFQAEGWPYLNRSQMPDERHRIRNHGKAVKAPRPGSRKLPDPLTLRKEADALAVQKGPRAVVGILKEKYQVSASAVRKSLNKTKAKPNGL